MPTPPPPPGKPSLNIPEELKTKFPELIALILGSESMNDEERQYWVNILSVMTPEQVKNLTDILTNERDQLKAIDQKYAKEINAMGQDELTKRIDEERTNRMQKRQRTERQAAEEEAAKTDALLKKIES